MNGWDVIGWTFIACVCIVMLGVAIGLAAAAIQIGRGKI